MSVTDKTKPESPKSLVTIECEGVRVNGEYCDAVLSLIFPRLGETGKGFNEAQRKTRARKIAAKDGWRAPKGFDECPRVHGFMPTTKAPARPEL